MSGTYTQLYLHLVWSTWKRLPLLHESIEPRLYPAFNTLCRDRGCTLIAVGGIEDHVHLLLELATTIPIAKLVADLKGSTSHLMTHHIRPGQFFKWQGGYSAFTLHEERIAGVKRYILNQKTHHAHHSLWSSFEPPPEPPAG